MAKISRRQFLGEVANANNISMDEATAAYNMIINGITAVCGRGDRLSLSGFGAFYLQQHKGHPVRFGKGVSDDYMVFKFSASGLLNKKFRDSYEIEPFVVKDV